jgi:transposase
MSPFLRTLDEDERREIERLAHSRTEQARLVERARIIWRLSQGGGNGDVAREMGINDATVRLWLRRFNEAGVQGLRDRYRPGGPRTYTLEQASEVVALALTRPGDLGLPFACWTLDRLEAYLNEQKGIAMKRSRIDEILLKEGLRWREEETWFSKRPDPRFAVKRGPSKGSTRPHPRAASSSA